MRRTKIVCTLGPSSSSREIIRGLIGAGMDVARLNCSHGDHASHTERFRLVREEAATAGRNVAILMDLQGPKIRTGRLECGGPVELREGASVVITTADIAGTDERIATTYDHVPVDVRPGDRILLADGLIELRVESVEPPDVRCRVVHGGPLGQFKGINLPGVPVSAPSITEKDRNDLELAMRLGADYVGLSFVRYPDDVKQAREIVKTAGKDTGIVAKIERPEAVDALERIVALSDGIMVARGDLGVEVPLCDVPQIQKRIISVCNRRGVPVITATQMLESMMVQPRPTRAEATDVANAIYDGTDAVMLSGETAAGKFPLQAVEIMRRIVEKADEAVAGLVSGPTGVEFSSDAEGAFSQAIGHAVRHLSETLNVRRIVCFTSSGYTARMMARYRPRVPITAFTLTEEAKRRCALLWGVEAAISVEADSIDMMIEIIERHLLENGLVQRGETIILVAGTPLAVAGRTNLLKLHQIGSPH